MHRIEYAKQLPNFSSKDFDLVKNSTYSLKKLCVDGICPIDEFISECEENPLDASALKTVLARIEHFCPQIRLTKEVFNYIDTGIREDVYEFKKKQKGTNAIRIYVIVKSPDMLIIMGGTKKGQKADIKKLKGWLKEVDFI